MIDREDLKFILLNKTGTVGSIAVFHRINKTTGFKSYKSIKLRDDNYNRQKQHCQYGLGPEVYEKVDLPEINEYGFYTEHVKPVNKEINKLKKSGIYENIYDLEQTYRDEVRELKKKIKETTGWNFVDAHLANVGINRKLQMVCLDFDNGFSNMEMLRV